MSSDGESLAVGAGRNDEEDVLEMQLELLLVEPGEPTHFLD